MSIRARARDRVDELDALRLEAGKLGFDVVYAVCEVV